ncbi:hypothetical protein GCK32_012720 [Trichostrongylus colubriformis]|uniref:Uncharacterized protein n=1 Tax=Trichostrongylus colubriformis TaxID=6319 RepID=A0AAN8FTP2_TRICO
MISTGGSFRPKSGGPRRSESVRRSNSVRRARTIAVEQPTQEVITPLSTPYITPRMKRNSQQLCEFHQRPARSMSQHSAYTASPTPCSHYDDDIITEFTTTRVQESNPEQLYAVRFPHETAIY